MTVAPFAGFRAALLDMAAPLPAGFAADAQTAARFAVHRHTCRTALIEALRSAYPAVVIAVGEAYFDALAAEFIPHSPPRSPVLQEYSPEFCEFLEHFPPLATWPWLADVARIDWARREAYHAADATPMTAMQLQALPTQSLLDASLALHPSLRTLDSSYPAWTLWHGQLLGLDAPADDAWRAESTQVWRVDGEVHQRLLGPGEALLRHGLAVGWTLGDAIHAAHALDPNFDAVTAFATLVGESLIVAVIHPS